MAIFISYSHQDAEFAHRLAIQLVENNAQIWIDSWELNVGDSLIDKIQTAIEDAGALLVILSRASVESEWCRKELNAGLIRELEEKRVIVLPVLKEECRIPPFLRDKKYADFRADFETGLHELLSAVAKFSNPEQGRIRTRSATTDWAETWGYEGDLFVLDFDMVESTAESEFTILTTISVTCNQTATRRYRDYEEAKLDWVGRMIITENLADLAGEKIQIVLEDARPKHFEIGLKDSGSDAAYHVRVRCRRMGEDNGKVQLVTISNYFRQIAEYVRSVSRKTTAEETKRLTAILARRKRPNT